MTLLELIEKTRSVLREPVAARWTDDDIKRYLNSGLTDLAKLSEKISKTTVDVTANTQSVQIPADVLVLKSIYWFDDTSGKNELYVSYDSLPEDDETTGVPSEYFTIDGEIVLYPIPETDGRLLLTYTKKPSLLVNDTDTPEYDNCEDALISYAVWRAYLEDGDPRAVLWENDYAKQALKWQTVESENYSQPFRVREWW